MTLEQLLEIPTQLKELGIIDEDEATCSRLLGITRSRAEDILLSNAENRLIHYRRRCKDRANFILDKDL